MDFKTECQCAYEDPEAHEQMINSAAAACLSAFEPAMLRHGLCEQSTSAVALAVIAALTEMVCGDDDAAREALWPAVLRKMEPSTERMTRQ